MKKPKAIVALKASPREPRRLVAHCYRRHGRAGDEIVSDDRVVSVFGSIDGIITRRPAVDVQSLLSAHHGKGKLIRHVVLSLEDCTDPERRADGFARLEKMAREFVAKFAPGAQFIAVIHRDRCHPHAHVFLQFGGRSHPRLVALHRPSDAKHDLDRSRQTGSRHGP